MPLARGREPELYSFINSFAKFLETSDRNLIEYSLDEMTKIRKKANIKGEFAYLDLEGIVLDSVQNRVSEFLRPLLSEMHDLLVRLYEKEEKQNYSSKSFFDKFAGDMKEIPKLHRPRVLDGAKKLLESNLDPGRTTRADLLLSYSRFSKENINILGEGIGRLVKKAMNSSNNQSEIVAFFEDKHNYFASEVDEAAGGLPLSKIHGRLLSYVQALSGRDINIESSQSSELSCSFNEDTFFFPQVINASKNNKENFEIYKALASYQTGAIMFGTYSNNIQDFFNSFKNPEFAKSLFEVMEFARLDSKLKEEFPGLRKDLITFKNNCKVKIGDGKKKSFVLSEIRNYICQEDEKDFSALGNLESVVSPEIQILRKKDSKPEETMGSVKRIYEKLDKIVDLSREAPLETIIDMEVEPVFADEGEKVKVPSYLIARPSKEIIAGNRFRYNEWDSESNKYKIGFVQVVQTPYPGVSENDYVSKTIQEDHITIKKIRDIFEVLRPEEFVKMKKQLSGELDYDLWVKAATEIAAGITPSEKLYTKKFRNQRSVASMILSENSGSLRKFLDLENPGLKLIDIIKKSNIYFSEALDAMGDNFALATFSGETEKNVNFYLIKDFDHPYDSNTKNAIGSMKPLQQNRDGAGLRHATHLLSQQSEKTRFLFYLMEGLPHDFGYEGDYAIQDTKKAIIESKYAGCIPVVVAFGKNIGEGIRSLADHCMYREIDNAESVPEALPNIYRRIAV